jgi:hypothetical protein
LRHVAEVLRQRSEIALISGIGSVKATPRNDPFGEGEGTSGRIMKRKRVLTWGFRYTVFDTMRSAKRRECGFIRSAADIKQGGGHPEKR